MRSTDQDSSLRAQVLACLAEFRVPGHKLFSILELHARVDKGYVAFHVFFILTQFILQSFQFLCVR